MYKGIGDECLRILIIYDISDQKRRHRIVKVLEGYGKRVQESAFECYIQKHKLEQLKSSLRRFINKVDSIRIYSIDEQYFDVVENRSITTLGDISRII